MAQPAFLTSGDAPQRRDTKWFRWVRILSRLQNAPGASAANNPKRTDTLRTLKEKVLSAITGVARGGCCSGFFPQAPSLVFEGENVTLTNLDYPEHPADSPTISSWQGYVSNSGTGNPISHPGEWAAVDVTDGQEDFATFDNAIPATRYGAFRVLIGGLWSPWIIVQNV